MADQISIDPARVEKRLGNFVMQMVGMEQRIEEQAAVIASKDAEIARLQAQLAEATPPRGSDA